MDRYVNLQAHPLVRNFQTVTAHASASPLDNRLLPLSSLPTKYVMAIPPRRRDCSTLEGEGRVWTLFLTAFDAFSSPPAVQFVYSALPNGQYCLIGSASWSQLRLLADGETVRVEPCVSRRSVRLYDSG
jgi:hypothetical protein